MPFPHVSKRNKDTSLPHSVTVSIERVLVVPSFVCGSVRVVTLSMLYIVSAEKVGRPTGPP